MKFLRMVGFAVMAVLMSVNYISCKEDGHDEIEMITIAEGRELSVYMGTSDTLHVNYEPSYLPAPVCTWSASDNSVVSLDETSGIIVPKKVGSVFITATTEKNLTADCLVKVLPYVFNIEDVEQTAYLGDTLQIRVDVFPENADCEFVWSSSNSKIVNVTDGMLYAVGIGSSKLRVTDRYRIASAECTVKVLPIDMESLELNQSEIEMNCRDEIELEATFLPKNATYTDLTWKSSDESVCKVVNGLVTAVSPGECLVSVTNATGKLSASCKVVVKEVKMETLVLNQSEIELIHGDETTLVASFTPQNTTYTDLVWKSSDEAVCTVTNGMVKAVYPGECVISVSNATGTLSANCTVTVKKREVESITLNKKKVEIEVNETITLTATINPSDATDQELDWSSSDSQIVEVLDGVLTAKSVGSCIITVTDKEGSHSATCSVTVKPISVKGITFDTEMGKYLVVGDVFNLANKYSITPSDAANQNVIWSTSNESILTVSDNGYVTAVGLGTALITVTTEDGNYSATCRITVVEDVTSSISFDRTGTAYSLVNGVQIFSATFTIKNNYLRKIHIVSVGGVTTVAQDLDSGSSVVIRLNSPSSNLTYYNQKLVFTCHGNEYSMWSNTIM